MAISEENNTESVSPKICKSIIEGVACSTRTYNPSGYCSKCGPKYDAMQRTAKQQKRRRLEHMNGVVKSRMQRDELEKEREEKLCKTIKKAIESGALKASDFPESYSRYLPKE